MKKATVFLLSLCLLAAICLPVSALRQVEIQKTASYQGQFADVPAGNWCAEYVKTVYEYGIMGGVSETAFNPNGTLSTAAAIAIACRLHNLYFGMGADFSLEGFWFDGYEAYAIKAGIIPDKKTYVYDTPVTRATFATFISNALYEADLQQINEIPDGSIPDVTSGTPYRDAVFALKNAGVLNLSDADLESLGQTIGHYESTGNIYEFLYGVDPLLIRDRSYSAIYRLYRAGILTGNDAYGTFTPNAGITRGSAAAMISRVLEPSLRKNIVLTRKPVSLVPMNQLANYSRLRKNTSQKEFTQAYEAARKIVEPLAHLDREAQICGIAAALHIVQLEGTYSMTEPHYNDPYGLLILHIYSCAGTTRACGLCLNMLGIPYEHMNENQYAHQWARVNVSGTYWACDANGGVCMPEKAPYKHPKM
ncbi:MAG: S-layer homology domain-containing protein [Oscillibacter sp.]|jgi:hypothetical protein|nr:S-layer homology domain-containing protein [Oscillibacter sp.]